MERLKQMKENLMACVSNQVCGNLAQVDTKELGEAIDMIKDLEEAIYYCTITKAMEEKPEHEIHHQGASQPQYYTTMRIYPQEEEMRTKGGKMYYDGGSRGNGSSNGGNGNASYYSNGRDGDGNSSGRGDGQNSNYFEPMYMTDYDYRDMREGSSPIYRKMYMESKELHHDKAKQMHELENYMQELSKDITEMIKDASPEEKQILQQKLTMLSSKIK